MPLGACECRTARARGAALQPVMRRGSKPESPTRSQPADSERGRSEISGSPGPASLRDSSIAFIFGRKDAETRRSEKGDDGSVRRSPDAVPRPKENSCPGRVAAEARSAAAGPLQGASRFLFDVGPSLATCRVERRRRHTASGGPTRTKPAMTKNRDAPPVRPRRFGSCPPSARPVRSTLYEQHRTRR